jgi:hypothetical protein
MLHATRVVEANDFPKTFTNPSANKTAQAVRSPFFATAGSLQLGYAFA